MLSRSLRLTRNSWLSPRRSCNDAKKHWLRCARKPQPPTSTPARPACFACKASTKSPGQRGQAPLRDLFWPSLLRNLQPQLEQVRKRGLPPLFETNDYQSKRLVAG